MSKKQEQQDFSYDFPMISMLFGGVRTNVSCKAPCTWSLRTAMAMILEACRAYTCVSLWSAWQQFMTHLEWVLTWLAVSLGGGVSLLKRSVRACVHGNLKPPQNPSEPFRKLFRKPLENLENYEKHAQI